MGEWTDREIASGIAFRVRDDGSVVSIEVCAECKRGFPREEHRVGYGSGRALCFNCFQIGPANSVPLADKVFRALDINVGRSASVLSGKLGARKAEAVEALRQLELAGRARTENQLWFAVERSV